MAMKPSIEHAPEMLRSDDRVSRLSRKYLIMSVMVTVGCLVVIAMLRLRLEHLAQLPIFLHLFVAQDYWAGWLMLAVLMSAFLVGNKTATDRLVDCLARHPLRTALVVFIALCAGSLLVYHDYPLSMDEYAPRFQSEVFASGHLAAKYPPNLLDWLIPPITQNYFFFVSHSTGQAISAYLPGFALLLTPFTYLGIPWAANPAIGAITLVALHRLAFMSTGDLRTAGWAMLFSLASPVFVVNAISYYSMSAHLLLNVLFTLALLKRTHGWALVAGLVGGLALVLHNPFPHALYALPWLAWLLYRREFRQLGWLLLGYLIVALPLGAGWIVFESQVRDAAQIAAAHNSNIAEAAWHSWLALVDKVLTPPNMAVIVFRLIGLLKIWLWSMPGLVLLAWAGYRSTKGEAVPRLLLASALLTFFGYFIVPFDQGHGWGYRYFHSAWGTLPVLAAFAMRDDQTKRGRVALIKTVGAIAIASLLFGNALRFYQVDTFIERHLAQIPAQPSANRTITFIQLKGGYYRRDLVQNGPLLSNRDLMMVDMGHDRNSAVADGFSHSAELIAKGEWGERWSIDAH